MHQDIQFQQASIAHLDLLLTLMADFYANTMPFVPAIAQSALSGILQNPAYGFVWLIQRQASTVGYVVLTLGYSLEYGGRDAFIDELYLQPSDRNQGIGTQTLHFLETTCRQLNIKALHLEVDRHNPKARELYDRVGFEAGDRILMTQQFR
ncbi:GNAT family N-acetyltransferase [Microcoleus sp. FACHB-1515]|uniref:GNAT family N-acetyltransferase n=1 Tax=Cyanophyceae TaxID=3028117 RepID=UPI0016872B68|nr:GNAT family N-acetyltransferase [Microcoleus sp. FACHB-1515]MBD2089238.1 GNAT family N-acetyltransferase [Microcoleus sp. FACHB-1515]